MERSPVHPSQSPFHGGWPNAHAVARLPESPPTQGDIHRNLPCDREGVPYTSHPTIAGHVGPGHSLSTSGNDGWNVLDQLQQQSRGPYALGDPTSLLPIPETLGDALPSFDHQAHQFSPFGGASAMPWTAHPPSLSLPISMGIHNPPLTVCHTSCPIGLGGSQMHWGSPSDQNNQWSSPANAYAPADEIPPNDEPYTPDYDRTVQTLCGWRCQDGTLCGATVTYHCQGHLASAHGITKLSGKTSVLCKWCYPDHQIRRECVLRHIREVHLGVPRSRSTHSLSPGVISR